MAYPAVLAPVSGGQSPGRSVRVAAQSCCSQPRSTWRSLQSHTLDSHIHSQEPSLARQLAQLDCGALEGS